MSPRSQPMLLVFDVNETLLDLETLAPHFERIFGDARVMREWFGQVILYSQALTLSGDYADFGEIGAAVLGMLGKIKGISVGDADTAAVKKAMAAMPAHPDAGTALRRLQEAGFRMVTLTNNPKSTAQLQLQRVDLAKYFERMMSIDETVKRYKPAGECYLWVADELGVPATQCCLIACHAWDTLGAAAAGMKSLLILRPGNAPLGVGRQPDYVGSDLTAAAEWLIRSYASR